MCSIYFNRKCNTRIITHQEYIYLAESEYRTLYCEQKWTVSKIVPASGFYVGDIKSSNGRGGGKRNNQFKDGGRESGSVHTNYWGKLT